MMRTALRAAAAAAAVLTMLVGATLAVRGQSGARNGEWPTYGGELANNARRIELAWLRLVDTIPSAGTALEVQ